MLFSSLKSTTFVKSLIEKTSLPDKSWRFISGIFIIQMFYHVGFLAVYYNVAGGVDGILWDMKLPDNLLFWFVTWFFVMGYGTRFFKTRYWILQALMFIPFCVVTGYMILFHSEMNAEMLNFFFRITWQDAADFTRTFMTPSMFYITIASILTWVTVMTVLYCLFFKPFLKAKIERSRSLEQNSSGRHFFVTYCTAGFLCWCLLFSDLMVGGILSQHSQVQIWNIQSDFITVFWNHIHKMFSYESGGDQFAKSMDTPLSVNGVSRFKSNFCGNAIVVLVLGESASRFRLNAFGYERDTTPFLSSISRGEDKNGWRAWLHHKTYSTSIATVDSVRGMFSFPTDPAKRVYVKEMPDDILLSEEEFINQKRYSVMKIFNELGWRTGWFSNNHTIGPFDTVGIGPIYNQAQEKFIVSAQDSLNTFRKNLLTIMVPKSVVLKKKSIDQDIQHYDEELLPVFEKFLTSEDRISEDNRTFAVLHLRGSHFYYQARYPSCFSVFGPSSELPVSSDALQGYYRRLEKRSYYANDTQWMEETKLARNFIDEYDNSILYTDYILEKVTETINLYNERRIKLGMSRVPAAVVFLSDHGEDVYVRRSKLPFRGLPGTEPMFTVPFAVLLNDEWQVNMRLPQSDIVMPNAGKYFLIPQLHEVFFRLMGIQETLKNG